MHDLGIKYIFVFDAPLLIRIQVYYYSCARKAPFCISVLSDVEIYQSYNSNEIFAIVPK